MPSLSEPAKTRSAQAMRGWSRGIVTLSEEQSAGQTQPGKKVQDLVSAAALCCQLDPRDLVPNTDSPRTFLSVVVRLSPMAAQTKVVPNWAKCRGCLAGAGEALGMGRRLETPHDSLTLPRWLMRIFCPIMQAFVRPVFDAQQDLTLRCAITGQFIGDDHARHV